MCFLLLFKVIILVFIGSVSTIITWFTLSILTLDPKEILLLIKSRPLEFPESTKPLIGIFTLQEISLTTPFLSTEDSIPQGFVPVKLSFVLPLKS